MLIVMDNTANWSQSFGSSTKFAAEKVALASVVNALKAQFNLGLMMFTETGGGNSNTDGGYVRFAIQDMTDSDGPATNCARLPADDGRRDGRRLHAAESRRTTRISTSSTTRATAARPA